MFNVEINIEILRWAIERAGLTIEDLRQKFPKIREWVSGQLSPTLRQLESLAKATSTPLGFFFLQSLPNEQLPIPLLRTLGDENIYRPSIEFLETVHAMQQRQDWIREFLIDQGQDRLSFVRSANVNDQPSIIAQEMRRILQIDENWASRFSTWEDALRSLLKAMEEVGLLVVINSVAGNNTHRKLDPNEFRGFVLVDDYAPLVFVNGADAKSAQMFTLAHEIAHVFLGSSAAFDLREMTPANNQVEKLCNEIAAEFLIPQEQLHQLWPTAKNEPDPFQTIARYYKVSTIVAARRTLDLGLITRNDFLKFYRDYLGKEKQAATRQQNGGNFYAMQTFRVGRKFASAVIQAVKEGKLLYSEAYKLTGLYGKSFKQFASYIEMEG
ncbi:MAG: ImmA/IrrE family metallo-endopeptidase [Anaerohalosphaeraceae bacterium]